MHVALLGLGAAGSHVARQLTQLPISRLSLHDIDRQRQRRVASAITAAVGDDIDISSERPTASDPPDVVILATPSGRHPRLAESWIRAGSHVVSIADDPDDVAGLLELAPLAEHNQRRLVVGAGFAPGLSCLLASYAASQLDSVDAINVYKAGTGGPNCARQHHRALKQTGSEWIDGKWVVRRGGSGRELAWFPDPFGARDCYRGALPSPMLLQPVFPAAQRISARMAATRRDRLTSWLPMMRPPHSDGGPGAIRVEVRGQRDGAIETVILGVMDHPSVAAGTVTAVATAAVIAEQAPIGAGGLATWSNPKAVLTELYRRGVRVASFNGVLAAIAAEE